MRLIHANVFMNFLPLRQSGGRESSDPGHESSDPSDDSNDPGDDSNDPGDDSSDPSHDSNDPSDDSSDPSHETGFFPEIFLPNALKFPISAVEKFERDSSSRGISWALRR